MAILTKHSSCAREAIVQHLDELEDIYLAERRLESVRSGRSRTVPIKKLIRRYER